MGHARARDLLSARTMEVEDSESNVAKLQEQIKELQARIEELEEELESESQAS